MFFYKEMTMAATKVDVDELGKKYQTLLQDEGYGCKAPTKDEQANTLDLIVKYEQMTFMIILDYDDPEFVRILLPNFFDIDKGQIEAALTAIQTVAQKCKGAKVYLTRDMDDTVAAGEFLENGNSVDAKQLVRYLSMVMNAAKTFAQVMQKG
jgi:hypothetical protein